MPGTLTMDEDVASRDVGRRRKRRVSLVLALLIWLLVIAFYPLGPRLVRFVWHMTHAPRVEYAGVCVPVPKNWFAYQGSKGPVLIRLEAVLSRRIWDLGYAEIAPAITVPFDKYRDAVKGRKGYDAFSAAHGLEIVCADSPEGELNRLSNTCLVEGKMQVVFVAPERYRGDFREVVRGITSCPPETDK